MRASNSHVLNVSLPLLIARDGRAMAEKLDFSIPTTRIPTKTLQAALHLVKQSEAFVLKQRVAGKDVYYVLSTLQQRYPNINPDLVQR